MAVCDDGEAVIAAPRTLARLHAPRQARLFRSVDVASLAVDAAIRRVWAGLLAVIREPGGPAHAYHRAASILRTLPAVISGELRAAFVRLFVAGRRAALATVRAAPLREAVQPAGLVQLALGRAGGLVTSVAQADDLRDLLLPGQSYDLIRALLQRFVQPAEWDRIGTDTDRRMPGELAHVLAGSVALGETQQQTAKKLRPFLDGSRVRARRAARTFGLHIAHQGQTAAWQDSFGEDLVGYTVHATIDEHTRPEHRARDGTTYWVRPRPGQKGLDEMPHPPLEADGSIAWNCRCWLSPVIGEPGEQLAAQAAEPAAAPAPKKPRRSRAPKPASAVPPSPAVLPPDPIKAAADSIRAELHAAGALDLAALYGRYPGLTHEQVNEIVLGLWREAPDKYGLEQMSDYRDFTSDEIAKLPGGRHYEFAYLVVLNHPGRTSAFRRVPGKPNAPLI